MCVLITGLLSSFDDLFRTHKPKSLRTANTQKMYTSTMQEPDKVVTNEASLVPQHPPEGRRTPEEKASAPEEPPKVSNMSGLGVLPE